MRLLNLVVGAWLIAAPWVIDTNPMAAANSIAVGVLVIACSLPRGAITCQYGGWSRWLHW
jgi:hypothetical protein